MEPSTLSVKVFMVRTSTCVSSVRAMLSPLPLVSNLRHITHTDYILGTGDATYGIECPR